MVYDCVSKHLLKFEDRKAPASLWGGGETNCRGCQAVNPALLCTEQGNTWHIAGFCTCQSERPYLGARRCGQASWQG